jgi:chromate reductase
MSNSIRLVALVGSLRKGSLNRALLRAAIAAAPAQVRVDIVEIGDLPLYNGDIQDQGMPASVSQLAEAMAGADGFLIATPEYNYSIPGVLKNAIDWLSRLPNPPFAGKPMGIMGASMGALGTARSQYHLRQVMVFLDAHVMNKPEVMVGAAHTKFDAEGKLTDASTEQHLARFMAALADFCGRFAQLPV